MIARFLARLQLIGVVFGAALLIALYVLTEKDGSR